MFLKIKSPNSPHSFFRKALKLKLNMIKKQLYFTALDASGTIRHSFVWGQNAWLGSKSECDFLNTAPKFSLTPELRMEMDKDLLTELAPIEMDFKIVFANFSSPYKIDSIAHLTVTLPKTLAIEFKFNIITVSTSFGTLPTAIMYKSRNTELNTELI